MSDLMTAEIRIWNTANIYAFPCASANARLLENEDPVSRVIGIERLEEGKGACPDHHNIEIVREKRSREPKK
jgi:hypothetical protein